MSVVSGGRRPPLQTRPEEDNVEGLTTIASSFGPLDTMDRLVAGVEAQGIRVFARINHAALAAEAGMTLGPTELLIFGNPRAGTPLMQAGQTMGIDLPLKALVWQDAAGKTWLSYNEPAWLANRHGIGDRAEQVVGKLAQALKALAQKAAGLQPG
jgi:uncharacterized protein (DUF302 family)